MLPREKNPRFCVQVTLAAVDTVQILQAAVTNRIYVVTRYVITGIIAAAQTLYLGDTSGTVKVVNLPVSIPAAGQQLTAEMEQGLPLTVSQALVIQPAAAGPSVHVLVEGYYINVGAF